LFITLDHAALAAKPTLHRSMFIDRARQFVERHRWQLRVDGAGLEVDDYDDHLATYCVVEDDDRHLASVRLRPAAYGCMVERSFPELARGREAKLRAGVEITRFCAAPGLDPDDRLTAVSDLLLGLCRHCQRTGIDGVFGVVFPSVARVIRQAGWSGTVLNRKQEREDALLLVHWAPSELVAWIIQERRELREELWARRRQGTELRLVA
jgi:N-acyl-L-homoserine lactone synthetase